MLVTMDVPQDIRRKIMILRKRMYSRRRIIKVVLKMTHGDKLLTEQYVNTVLHQRKVMMNDHPELYKSLGKQLLGIGLLVLVVPTLFVFVFPEFVFLWFGIIAGPVMLGLGAVKYSGFME
jgi:hypothetical protein